LRLCNYLVSFICKDRESGLCCLELILVLDGIVFFLIADKI
jgi:hypothetical protein